MTGNAASKSRLRRSRRGKLGSESNFIIPTPAGVGMMKFDSDPIAANAMPIYPAEPFPTDALEANRSGHLTTEQRDRLRPLARYARQSAFIVAVVLAVASAMMVSDRQLSLPAVPRVPLAGVCLVLAAFFLLRAIIGGDALTRDLRHMKVQTAEGPIGKRRGGSTGRSG